MASLYTTSAKLLLLLLTFLNVLPTHPLQFNVGWKVPSPKNVHVFNDWASHNRFQIGDIIRFNYTKDSVMVVSKEEYVKCKPSHPIFFSNSGHTEYELHHSGMYYFISGVTDHCLRGQKMLIKALSHSEAPGGSPDGGNQTGTTPPPPPSSPDVSAAVLAMLHAIPKVFVLGSVLVGLSAV